ncbi:hypothetical protein GAH_00155 [Geoglobus ahangari]|uniref:KaiC-like domain-containing protein n=1 Tax=Geoglobus ahangari TaxID=113653 RepID=A0A0F7DCA2_9EURY|nr:hypothetical protein [Geoglobus ahangari]AKG92486.1 hypothetical protein GAH_00155 [Geoglobus ahangari]NOY11931.1 hypothetical protein [Archaeoglobi archaeon]
MNNGISTLGEFFSSLKGFRTLVKVDNPVIPVMLTLNHIIPKFGRDEIILVFLTRKDRRLFKIIREQFGIECDIEIREIFVHKDRDVVPSKIVLEKLRRLINEKGDKIMVIFGFPTFVFFYGQEGVMNLSILFDLIPDDVTLINFCLIDIADQATTTYQKSLYDVLVSIKRVEEHPDRYVFEVEHSALQQLTNKIGYMITEGFLIKEFTIKSREEYI